MESIREYLYAVFAFSSEYNGLMACLWDTSNKTLGEMNFYNRAINKWYDEKIKENLMEISKGKYIKSSEYYLITNKQRDEIVSQLNIIRSENINGRPFD
jgi:hypothetical protein